MTARPPLDPDPRYVDDDDLWDPRAGVWTPRPSPIGPLILGGIVGILFGLVIGLGFARLTFAAPRAAPVIPAAPSMAGTEPDQGQLGAPRDGVAVEGSRAEATGEAAAPAAGVGAPTITGVASWCAPTPTHCQRWGGDAHLGAVRSFRWGDDPYDVRVCRQDDPRRCTTATVVSYCGCPGNRVIDLSPAAFAELAPLRLGLVDVTVELDTAATPPPTSTKP